MSLQLLINEAVRRDDHKQQTSWHPSALGSCLTGQYLQRKGVTPDEDFDDRTLRVFSVGKMFEDWVVERIKEKSAGHIIKTQERIEWPEYDVTGYADISVDDMVYEIKSKNSRAFTYMSRSGANRQHEMQLWTYLHVLQKPRGTIVYLSKDDLRIAEYLVFLNDQKLREEVLNELTILNRAWKEQLPPPVTFDEKDWRAKYCRWHKQCTNQPQYLTI